SVPAAGRPDAHSTTPPAAVPAPATAPGSPAPAGAVPGAAVSTPPGAPGSAPARSVPSSEVPLERPVTTGPGAAPGLERVTDTTNGRAGVPR
ncbi:MAG TPA: hypothetical protein VMU09_02780, partial [Acidimicrobiales bacterium]|nr:hypothetical protein [Acidimicrobiales bacterium]